MIVLERVRIQNFLSYMTADVCLIGRGCPILVIGRNTDSTSCESNGSGKSAIFEAVAWGLYGSTLRGLTSKEVTRKGLGKCCVSVVFSIRDEGDRDGLYTVSRHQKDGAAGNTLAFSREGELIPAKDKREAQQQIETILGVDFQLFCESTILGQDSLCFATATDAEKKRILEHVAQLQKFDTYLAETKARLSAARGELQTLGTNAARLGERKNNLFEERQRVARASESFERRKQQRLTLLELELQTCQDRAVRVGALQENLNQLTFDESALESWKVVRDERKVELSKLESEVAQLTAKMQLVARQAHETQLELDAVADVCSMCKRPFDTEAQTQARATLRERVDKLTSEADDAQRDVCEAEGRKGDASMVAQTADGVYETAREKQSKYLLQRNELQGSLQVAQQEAQRATRIQSSIDSEKLARNADADRLSKLDVGLEQVNTELDVLDLQQTALREKVTYLEFWEKGFGKKGIRSYVLDHVANALNAYAAKYSQYLTDGEIEVVFTTQRKLASGEMSEDFRVQGLNQHGADVYKGNSVGERQRVDMCVSLALQDLIRSRMSTGITLFVCDEAAANLDREGAERMLGLLNDMARDSREVFYITHDTALQDLFTHQLEVVKQGGVSRIGS